MCVKGSDNQAAFWIHTFCSNSVFSLRMTVAFRQWDKHSRKGPARLLCKIYMRHRSQHNATMMQHFALCSTWLCSHQAATDWRWGVTHSITRGAGHVSWCIAKDEGAHSVKHCTRCKWDTWSSAMDISVWRTFHSTVQYDLESKIHLCVWCNIPCVIVLSTTYIYFDIAFSNANVW